MRERKELTTMQAIWNRYHVANGMSDRSRWSKHQYYSLGTQTSRSLNRRFEEEEPQKVETTKSTSNYGGSSMRARAKVSQAADRESARNYQFLKGVGMI